MNQTCYALATTTRTPFSLFCRLREEIDALVHAAHGSVFDTITTSTFASSRIVLPPQAALREFEERTAPVFRRVLRSINESRTLATLRDTLLPQAHRWRAAGKAGRKHRRGGRMSSLKMLERDCFENLFGMGSGYVMDFSNRTFSEFFQESVRADIYADKYAANGDSKARRLRAFIELEPDPVVGKALSDLLEYWRYKTPQSDAKVTALAERGRQVVERLLGKSAPPRDSGQEFLRQDFGRVALDKISTAGPLVPILEARLGEAIRCLKADSPLAVIFHCGSILEGLLLGLASANPQQFNQAPNSPKDRVGNVRQLHEWTLAQFIDVAWELGYLKLDVKKFSHALREFRNFIHPYEQMSARFNPDRHTAEICLQVLRAAIASLSGGRAS